MTQNATLIFINVSFIYVFLGKIRTSHALRSRTLLLRNKNTANDTIVSIAVTDLVAEMGFEPHDLRVMSPTSYRAALLRDIYSLECLVSILHIFLFVNTFFKNFFLKIGESAVKTDSLDFIILFQSTARHYYIHLLYLFH